MGTSQGVKIDLRGDAEVTPGDAEVTPASSVTGPDALDAGEADDHQPGELIGAKYALTRRLSSGGMGSLWIARDETLDVDVVIKLLRLALRERRELVDRMLNEARATAKLRHPAIVRVMDFGRTNLGEPYIVMELLEGSDLGQRIEQSGRIPPIRAVQTLLPILHALAVVHAKGVVHRDVKPDNIFLARVEGGHLQPKLIDFGVVKLAQGSTRVTAHGAMVGTPGYMSPEQARGKESDFRTDLWAMCVVLYELVTGELPFDGDNWNAIMHAILGKDPRPITDFDVGDATLWTIIERGLSKDIGERWESAQLLGRALASWLVSVGVYEDITGRTLTKMWRVDDLDEVLSSRRPDPESDDPFARPSLSSIPDSSGGWTPYSSDKGLLRRTPLSGSTGPAAASHATDDDLRSSLITSASDRAPMPGAAPTGARRVQLVALGALAACIVAVAIWRLSGPDTTARGDEPPTPQAMTTAAPEPNATHPSKATATAPAAGPEEAKPEEVVAPAMSVSALPVIVAPPSWTAPAPPRPAAPAGPPPPPLASPPRPPPPPPPPALKPPSFD